MASKITYIKIGKKEYPLNFSLRVLKKINEKYTSVENMQKELVKSTDASLDGFIWLLNELINDGYMYLHKIDNLSLETIDAVTLESIISISDIAEINKALLGAMDINREVVATIQGNAQTTQDKTEG